MKRICVYCGSADGASPEYANAAQRVAAAFVEGGIELVYGGARVGVMGAIADAVLAAGGTVIGVLPKGLFRAEVPHSGLTELIEVKSMHERKSKMAEISDGFIALPGGLGTIEELFEILTGAQLGLHRNPVGLLNVNGFYNKLLEYLDHAVTERFIRPQHKDMIIVETEIDTILSKFSSYDPPTIKKWFDLTEQ